MDHLNKLNDEQKAAVLYNDGPMMVLAGAGSGKTRTIIAKIVHLIKVEQVLPWKILAVTFSNRAANEMKERIRHQLPEVPERQFNLSTFHSFCVRVLRKHAEFVGLNSNFTIFDDSESNTVAKRILKEHDIDPKKIPPSALTNFADKVKNEGFYIGRPNFVLKKLHRESELYPLFLEYENELARNNALDFGSLITKVIQLLESHPEVKDFYNQKFDYVLVDEYQDTNRAQFDLIRLMTEVKQKICVVGDADQCLAKGTLISLADGKQLPIEQIKPGMMVLSAQGHNKVIPTKVTQVYRKKYKQEMIKITLKSGTSLLSTPEHIHFAKFDKKLSPQCFITYLMYKKNMGFRIGKTQIYNNKQPKNKLGFFGRSRSENADKIWVLETFKSEEDARLHEQITSLNYGIPTSVFNSRNSTQPFVNRIFSELDTVSRGTELLQDLKMSFNHPALYCQSTDQRKDRNFIITLLGGTKKNDSLALHRFSLLGKDTKIKKAVEEVIPTRKSLNGWRTENSVTELKSVYNLYNKLKEKIGLNLFEKILINHISLPFTPASHIRVGMVMMNNQMKLELVTKVERVDYQDYVYDLNIERSHNFIANNIFTHNSIYSWRGAELKNILDYEKTFPNAKIYKLEENYRSSKNIVEAATEVIKNNILRKEKEMKTSQAPGEKIRVYQCMDSYRESHFVAQSIADLLRKKIDPKEIAIFYRTNAQSRGLEDALRNFLIPYKIIGGVKFYERKEIKDLTAYLRVLVNPQDEVSLLRIINTPSRGIGDKTVESLMAAARDQGQHLLDYLKETLATKPKNLGGVKVQTGLRELLALIAHGQKQVAAGEDIETIYETVLDSSHYLEVLKASKKVEDEARIENLQELKSSMIQFKKTSPEQTLSAYLETITLDQTAGEEDAGPSVSLMTIHSSKGLEFDYVFLVGVEEHLFPSPQSDNEGHERLEEERRLFYVSMTRARKLLCLFHCLQRNLYGKTTYNPPSRFLNEIPKHFVQKYRV